MKTQPVYERKGHQPYQSSPRLSGVNNRNEPLNKLCYLKSNQQQSPLIKENHNFAKPLTTLYHQKEQIYQNSQIKPKENTQIYPNLDRQHQSHLYTNQSHIYANQNNHFYSNQKNHQFQYPNLPLCLNIKTKEVKPFNQHCLSNAIYLKSSNPHDKSSNQQLQSSNQQLQSYDPAHYQPNKNYPFHDQYEVNCDSRIAKNQSQYFKPLSHQNIAPKAYFNSLNHNLSSNQNFITTNCHPHEFILSMINKYGYSPELLEQKELKQTRQNSHHNLQSSRKIKQSPTQTQNKSYIHQNNTKQHHFIGQSSFIQQNSQLQQIQPTKTYLKHHIPHQIYPKNHYPQQNYQKQNVPLKVNTFSINHHENKHFVAAKTKQTSPNMYFSPDKTQILIQEYNQQNSIIQNQNQTIQKEIISQIQKQRYLLHKLNLLMTQLQTFKSTQKQPTILNSSQIAIQTYPKIHHFSCEQNPNKLLNPQSDKKPFQIKQTNQQTQSILKKSTISKEKVPSIQKKNKEQKQNLIFVQKRKFNLSVAKREISCKNSKIPQTNPILEYSLLKELNSNTSLIAKNQNQSIDLQISCFDSKFVPRMSNRQKLNQLEEKFQDQLKKYFQHQNFLITTVSQVPENQGRTNNFKRESKGKKNNLHIDNTNEINKKGTLTKHQLKLLSHQIKILRSIVSQQEKLNILPNNL